MRIRVAALWATGGTMIGRNARRLAIMVVLLAAGCSRQEPGNGGNDATLVAPANLSAPAPVPDNTAAPAANAAAPVATTGFDPASAPVGKAPPGSWPYFSLVDGYEPLSLKNKPGDSSRTLQKDVAYDRYEIFDGTRIVPVEGRLYTARGLGTGASFFQVQKTYEKLVHDLGGVTVFEGTGQAIKDKGLKFAEGRHRGQYNLESEKTGVYMVRLPDGRQLCVEVWKRWQDEDDSYWLTVVETKPLEVKAKLLDAEAMKAALDRQGHVALYINFDTDKTAIKSESQPTVGEIVKLLTADPALKLEVQGHTDNAGTPAHNQTLSEGRATAVVGALMGQGIAMTRLTSKGYGQTKPIADNGSEEGRSKNRRVELVKK